MYKMLISVARWGELRLAIIKGTALDDLDIEYPGLEQNRSNIYKATITRIEPGLEAVFVNYGRDRHGFLPLKEISRIYFLPTFSGDLSNINIKEVLKEGMELIVQVEKEERGNKGAALTTFISLAGSYVVLMPNNPRAGGISRRIEGEERDELREILPKLNLPPDMGIIIRTAGIGRSIEELQWDLDLLLKQWESISKISAERPAPLLIYKENDIVVRAVRDYLRQDISEIIIDDKDVYEKIRQYIQQIKPDFYDKIKLYENKIPLFAFYQIEKQIETAYQCIVHLPSGGSIVIDHTEALTSIDVNSAKATGGSDIEETALHTNLEAAEEIARQLRLRDIGGLIVIDFIDMTISRNQREISQKLRDLLKVDRARVQVGNITRFGLLEMSRQRLHPYIGETMRMTCPRCDGQGTIRGLESLAHSIIHMIEENAAKEKTKQIQVQVPIDLATFILNEQRDIIAEIEKRLEVQIFIIPNQHLETPKYKIRRIKAGEIPFKPEKKEASYSFIEKLNTEIPQKQITLETSKIEEPALRSSLLLEQPAPPEVTKSRFFSNLKRWLKVIFAKKHEVKQPPAISKPRPDFKRRNQPHFQQRRYQDKKFRKRPPQHFNNRRPQKNFSSPQTQEKPNNER